MNDFRPSQTEFDFEAGTAEGYSGWVACRQAAEIELARRLCLPLGHQVEVWLLSGIRLRGRLALREEQLFIDQDQLRRVELTVDHTPFFLYEMESCVRLD